MDIFVKAQIRLMHTNRKTLLLFQLVKKNNKRCWLLIDFAENVHKNLPTLKVKHQKIFKHWKPISSHVRTDSYPAPLNIPLMALNETTLPFDERQLKYIKVKEGQSFFAKRGTL